MAAQLLWGKKMEPLARQRFVDDEATRHTDFEVRLSGLVVNPQWPYLGASPDGVVSCPCCPQAVLKMKCPYKYRHTDLTTVKDKDFYLDRELKLKVDHAYYF